MQTSTCPTCGTNLDDRCMIIDCKEIAEFEAWFQVKDKFTGEPTARNVLMRVCDDHVKESIGYKNGKPFPSEVG